MDDFKFKVAPKGFVKVPRAGDGQTVFLKADSVCAVGGYVDDTGQPVDNQSTVFLSSGIALAVDLEPYEVCGLLAMGMHPAYRCWLSEDNIEDVADATE